MLDRILTRYPDFVCLGAQKSATTWLDNILRAQSNVFLPPIKELHYFSQLYNTDASQYGPCHRQQQSDVILKHLENGEHVGAMSEDLIKQAKHVASAAVDDAWYSGIFSPAPFDSVCVEICPSYMNMPMAAVQHLLRLNPSVRLLVVVRDPIDRCWSQIRMHAARGGSDADPDKLVSGETSLYPYLFYTEYEQSISRWERFTSLGQLKVILHDDIRYKPKEIMSEIFNFMSIDATLPDHVVKREVFTGESLSLPVPLHRILWDSLKSQYDFLELRFPEAVAKWRIRHMDIIE